MTIDQSSAQADPTVNQNLEFVAHFSEAVYGFDANDVVLSGDASVTSVAGGPETYTILVHANVDGVVTAAIPAGGAHDAAGNLNTDSTSTDSSVSGSTPAPPLSACTRTGGESIGTSQSAYTAGETVEISGSGFAPACDVTLTLFNATWPGHQVDTATATTDCPTNRARDVTVRRSTAVTINPGIYRKILVSSNGTLTLNPGTYVITSKLLVNGNAVVSGNGVTLYFACSGYPTVCPASRKGARFRLTGNGALNLSAPASGTFAGIAIVADRNNTSTDKLRGIGAGFVGAVYLKRGALELTGDGNTLEGRVIVDTVKLSGGSWLVITP